MEWTTEERECTMVVGVEALFVGSSNPGGSRPGGGARKPANDNGPVLLQLSPHSELKSLRSSKVEVELKFDLGATAFIFC